MILFPVEWGEIFETRGQTPTIVAVSVPFQLYRDMLSKRADVSKFH